MSVVTLYRMHQVVELTTPTGAALMNYPVNRTDFTLARYVDNEVEFWIKNIDRKAVSLAGMQLVIHVTDQHERVILTRNLIVLDAVKGLVRLFVAAEETALMQPGFCRYSIVMTRANGQQTLLYTDRDRRGSGVIEVVSGPLPPPVEPIRLSLSDFISRNGRLYSGAQAGAAQIGNVSGQHSAEVVMRDFTGRITIQGTLATQPSSADVDWFDVVDLPFTLESDNRHIPFEGNFMHVRFVVSQTAGSIEQIQYLN